MSVLASNLQRLHEIDSRFGARSPLVVWTGIQFAEILCLVTEMNVYYKLDSIRTKYF